MSSIGVIRKMDTLGRVVLPIEHRRELGIGDHDIMEIIPTETGFIVQKAGERAKRKDILIQLKLGLELTYNQQIKEILQNTIQYVEGL